MREGWTYKKLGEVSSFTRGLTYSKNDVAVESSNKVLRSNNIDLATHSLNFDDVACLKEEFVIPSEKKLRQNDIFICMSNGSTQHLGKVAFVEKNLDYAFGGFMGAIHPQPSVVYPKFVFYYCMSAEYRRTLASVLNGININNLKWSDLSKFPIPVPPLSEQQRIVSELDLLSGIIEKKKAQLKEYDQLAQSIFFDMFGDPVTNEKGWEMKKLGEVCNHITDGDHMPPPKSDKGIPFLTIANIDKDKRILDFNNTFFVPQEYYDNLKEERKARINDMLYTVTGSYGIPVIIRTTRPFCFQRHIALLRPNQQKVLTIFLFNWALCSSVKKEADLVATGIAQKTVGLNSLRQFIVPLPPLSLQQSFASKIEAIERQKSLIQQSITEAETLFNSRMDYWFS